MTGIIANVVVILLLVIIVGSSLLYIRKEKERAFIVSDVRPQVRVHVPVHQNQRRKIKGDDEVEYAAHF